MTPEEVEAESQKVLARYRASGESQDIFAELLALHRQAVLAFVHRRLGLPIEDDRVEDVAQECWVEVVLRLPSYAPRPGARFRAWLFTILKAKCIDALRAAGTLAETTRRSLDEAQDVTREADPGELDSMDQPDLRRELDAAIADLPAEQQEVLRLREEGLTFEAMHERTGTPLATLKKRVALAMKKLKPILLRYHGREE